jgi:multicomponent Na+:H+ antiporter subunit C
MSTTLIYGACGIALVAIGLYRAVLAANLIRRVIAINVVAVGISSVLLATAYREGGSADPVPHAFVLTGIVVLVSTTAVALTLIRRLQEGADDGR